MIACHSLRQFISRYQKATKMAATTARPAPSVAVTRPPKMPARMISGSSSAKAASLKVRPTRLRWNTSSTG